MKSTQAKHEQTAAKVGPKMIFLASKISLGFIITPPITDESTPTKVLLFI